jgi:hypothetical protein
LKKERKINLYTGYFVTLCSASKAAKGSALQGSRTPLASYSVTRRAPLGDCPTLFAKGLLFSLRPWAAKLGVMKKGGAAGRLWRALTTPKLPPYLFSNYGAILFIGLTFKGTKILKLISLF